MITILNYILVIFETYLIQKTNKAKGNTSKKSLNGKKKIPFIPTVYHNDEFSSYIKKKYYLFNLYFSEQSIRLVNNNKVRSALTVHIKQLLKSFHFSADQFEIL